MPVLLTSGALSDPVLRDTVVQHWLLAIDRDSIAVGLSFESPPVHTTPIHVRLELIDNPNSKQLIYMNIAHMTYTHICTLTPGEGGICNQEVRATCDLLLMGGQTNAQHCGGVATTDSSAVITFNPRGDDGFA